MGNMSREWAGDALEFRLVELRRGFLARLVRGVSIDRTAGRIFGGIGAWSLG